MEIGPDNTIHKPGKNPTFPQHYRPISLLSHMSKIAERIILDRLTNKAEKLNIIPHTQFGFRPMHSTTLQAARLTETIIRGLNSRKYTAILALDIQKAFDRVWHHGLIFKLHLFNFSLPIIKLIASFLHRRAFQMKLNSTLSTIRMSQSGVPQSSPLSPLLYSIFTADIPANRHTSLFIYADDTAITAQAREIQTLQSYIQEHYNQLKTWYHQWKIQINLDKTQLICITKRRQLPNRPLGLDNQEIRWQDNIKYLGITYDNHFTWKAHIDSSVNKVLPILYKLLPVLGRKSRLSTENNTYLRNHILGISCQTTREKTAGSTKQEHQDLYQSPKICHKLPTSSRFIFSTNH